MKKETVALLALVLTLLGMASAAAAGYGRLDQRVTHLEETVPAMREDLKVTRETVIQLCTLTPGCGAAPRPH